MKTLLFTMLLCTGLAAQAQRKSEPIPGSWVIESNVQTPKKQTVKFYNANQQLLYQEDYNQKVLNCSRKRIRNLLDGVLITVLSHDSIHQNQVFANLICRKNK